MAGSQRPSMQDVVELVRWVSELRDLRDDPLAQRRELMRLCLKQFDARRGFSVVFEDLRPGGACRPTAVVAAGSSPACEAGFLELLHVWSEPGLFTPQDDPLIVDAAAMSRMQRASTVGLGMDPERWQRCRMYQVLGEAARARDIMVAQFPSGDQVLALAVHRMSGQRPFSRRDLVLMRVLNAELARLHAMGCLDWVPRSGGLLSERQREIGALMLRGLNAKQIAAELGVATETVYGHAKAMYRRVGVGDRLEMVAWLRAHPREIMPSAREAERVIGVGV